VRFLHRRVKHLDPNVKYGIALTEKEKEMLKQLGKITKARSRTRKSTTCRRAIASPASASCATRTSWSPSKAIRPSRRRAHITHAAQRFKGGTEINTLDEFLGYAVKVEEDAAIHFDELAAEMEGCGNHEVGKLFRQLAASRACTSRRRNLARSLDLSKSIPPIMSGQSGDARAHRALGRRSDADKAGRLKAALQGERRGYEFYAPSWRRRKARKSPQWQEFVKEEAEHVRSLKPGSPRGMAAKTPETV